MSNFRASVIKSTGISSYNFAINQDNTWWPSDYPNGWYIATKTTESLVCSVLAITSVSFLSGYSWPIVINGVEYKEEDVQRYSKPNGLVFVVNKDTEFIVSASEARIQKPVARFVNMGYNTDTDLLFVYAMLENTLGKGRWGIAITVNGGEYIDCGSSESLSRLSYISVQDISGMPPEAEINLYLYNTDGITTEYTDALFQIKTPKARLPLFHWTDDDETYIAKGMSPSNLTAAKWNLLLQTASDVYYRKTGTELPYTRVSAGDRITASAFNSCRIMLQRLERHGTIPPVQHYGDPLLAELFIELKDAINKAIDYSNSRYR